MTNWTEAEGTAFMFDPAIPITGSHIAWQFDTVSDVTLPPGPPLAITTPTTTPAIRGSQSHDSSKGACGHRDTSHLRSLCGPAES